MKRLPKYLLISIFTFLIGLISASIWLFTTSNFSKPQIERAEVREKSIPEIQTDNETPKEGILDEETSLFDSIWIEDNEGSYGNYKIKRECSNDSRGFENCTLKITGNNRVLAKYEVESARWAEYGFFNLLGKKNEQLIIRTYSGGAHCCYTYFFYDLNPNLRLIFNGSDFSTDEDGLYENVVDLNKDGQYEFIQSVTVFDYFHASHSGSVFPPVVFGYDSLKGKYVVANKKFPEFILGKLQEDIKFQDENFGLEKDNRELMQRFALTNLLHLTYAGREKEGWKFFDKNYKFKDKDEFRKDIRKQFSDDSIYKSLYSK
jgi:hypothetical protein